MRLIRGTVIRTIAIVAAAIPLVALAQAPGALEGRPAAAARSPLQSRVDQATPGATLIVEPGTYRGDLLIDKPLTLIGRGQALLVGSGGGSVVRVRADDVTIEGFAIDGGGGGDLGRDSAGIHVSGRRVTVRGARIRNALFGVYLHAAHGAVVEDSEIIGIPGKAPGEKGSGIHVWNTDRFSLARNVIRDVRDGFYIQSSPNGLVTGNTAIDLRYGLHYMFSDDNVFEDNTFENGAAGAALMYSRRLVFRRNRFVRNRGFASVGLLLRSCEDVEASDNLVADNARGLFVEGAIRNVFERNIIAASDVALVLYDSNSGVRFSGNAFVGNLSPLTLVGRRTDTIVSGNYWSDHGQPDLDGDGVADRPYRLSNVFDHFRGNLTAADLFADGIAARAIGAAERTFPVLRATPVVDERPLARPPALPDVPVPDPEAGARSPLGLGLSAGSLIAGLLGWRAGRRGRAFRGARL